MNHLSLQQVFKHQFHLVNRSQLPFLAASFAMLLTMSIVFYLHSNRFSYVLNWDHFIFHTSAVVLICIILGWFFMIVFESGKGYHTFVVQNGLRLGFWLFIVSEIMLFFSFFWAYFHYKLNPSVSTGSSWAPLWNTTELNITIIDPYKIPLLNTLILLSSGFTATFAHRVILKTDFNRNGTRQNFFFISLLVTIVLGYIFLICQLIEYTYGIPFSWMSNVYWSIFFLLTGFHGMHVVIGTLYLHFNFCRFAFAKIFKIYLKPIFLLDYKAVTMIFIQHFFYILLKIKPNIKYILNLAHMSIIWFVTLHGVVFFRYINSFLKSKGYHSLQNIFVLPQNRYQIFIHTVRPAWYSAKKKIIWNYKASHYRKISYKFGQKLLMQKWLFVKLRINLSRYQISTEQHLGLEGSLYYWHFVDIIWILLYLVVYLSN